MKRLLPRLLLTPAVASLLLWMIVPLVMTIYFSVIRYNLMQPEVTGFAGLENFEYFLTDPSFTVAVVNTLLLLGSVVFLESGALTPAPMAVCAVLGALLFLGSRAGGEGANDFEAPRSDSA